MAVIDNALAVAGCIYAVYICINCLRCCAKKTVREVLFYASVIAIMIASAVGQITVVIGQPRAFGNWYFEGVHHILIALVIILLYTDWRYHGAPRP